MKVINYIKGITILIGMLVIALLVTILGMPWWGNPVINRMFMHVFSSFVCMVVGIDLQIIDESKVYLRSPAIFIGNHQSALDMALIGKIAPKNTVIVAKKEVKFIPILGWYFMAGGNLFLDRSNKKDAHSKMMSMAEALVDRNLVAAIFPEGTRNKVNCEEIQPLKKGAFHIAFSKGLPIIPVVCSSLHGIAILEQFDLGGGKVRVKVLDPIETKNIPMSEINVFIEKVRVLMQTELTLLNDQLKKNA